MHEKMKECIKNSDHQNFVCLYLAFAYVGYKLKGYTEAGLKQVHSHICRKLGNEPKCTSRCSETYGRNVKKWCNTCRSWQNDLQDIMRFKEVAWERMESWKWPISYINIVEVFVPTICSMHTINLNDLYIESYVWANCKRFCIDQKALKKLRVVRNAVVHNSISCVINIQKDKCFNAMQTLLNDSDVKAYLNVKELENILSYLQDIKSKAVQHKDKILSAFRAFRMKENPQDVTEIETEVSSKRSCHSRKKDIHEEFQIHQTILKRLTTVTVLIRPFLADLRFNEVTLLSFCAMISIKGILIGVVIVIMIFAYFLRPYIDSFLLACVFRFSEYLIRKDVKCQELEKTVKYLVTDRGEWDRCLKAEDTAMMIYLLNSDHLPNKEQLKRACTIFTRFSIIIGLTTDKICETIKKKNVDKVKRVWAAYKPGKENNIIFVIVTKELNAPLDFKPEYDVKYRQHGDFSSESRELILEESERNLYPGELEIVNIQQCINKYTSKLVEKHSNLTIISASLLKCKGYGTKTCVRKEKACIVLHVHIKGLIPLNESMFPKTLDGVDIDVREGCLEIHSGKGPHEKHNNVKMGCGIKAKELDDAGTLGGFLDHPEYGLCALTCAHLFIDEIPKGNDKKTFDQETIECMQPCYPKGDTEESRFGVLRLSFTGERSSGGRNPVSLDYALIAVDKSREPLDGSFPHAKREEWLNAGFKNRLPSTYDTGKIVDFMGIIKKRSDRNVVKYGSTTILTCGVMAWNAVQHIELSLKNQIQINITKSGGKETFSAGGDSGALVFHVDDEDNLTAVGLLVGGSRKLGFSFATPICDILKDVKIKSLKRFTAGQESIDEIKYHDCLRKLIIPFIPLWRVLRPNQENDA